MIHLNKNSSTPAQIDRFRELLAEIFRNLIKTLGATVKFSISL